MSRLASWDPIATIHRPFGGGVIGNTLGSGPSVEGSSPSPRAMAIRVSPSAPSSSGLGRWPLKPVTPVQIRSGLPGTLCVPWEKLRFSWEPFGFLFEKTQRMALCFLVVPLLAFRNHRT
jgi:hypothetical protein